MSVKTAPISEAKVDRKVSSGQLNDMVRRAARESVQEALIQNGNEGVAPPSDSSLPNRK